MLKNVLNYTLKTCAVTKRIDNNNVLIKHAFTTHFTTKYPSCTNYKPTKTKLKSFGAKRFLSFTSASKAKMYQSTENSYAYSILQTIPLEKNVPFNRATINKNITSEEDFEQTLNQNFRLSTATDIVATFENLLGYVVNNDISVDDVRFNNLVDGLMDHCEKLTDDELSALMHALSQYPPVESFNSHNFHDIWSALDDTCCLRQSTWPVDKQFRFADLWFNLHMARVSDYVKQFLNTLSRKPSRLSTAQVVHAFFYKNVSRRNAVSFEFEHRLHMCINDLTIDQLAVVSMGYFKTKSMIRIPLVLDHLIERLTVESSTVHEITLCSLLKIIRYSPHLKHLDKINNLIDKLLPEVDRLSVFCCVHIALLGTNAQLFHPRMLKRVAQKIATNVKDARVKDLERLLFALTIFNFDPKTEPDIFDASLRELKDPQREAEFIKHPRCMPCSLLFLSFRRMYPYDLISKVLDASYITNAYGVGSRNVGREIFTLDNCMRIECPDYVGNALPTESLPKIAKWLTEYVPTRDQKKKLSVVETMMLDIVDEVSDIVGGREFYRIKHILPYTPRADIIVCRNKAGQFVRPIQLDDYVLGDVMYPSHDDNLQWFTFVIASWNNTIRGTSLPIGTVVMKMRHLERIGYTPVLITYNDFARLRSMQRKNYIISKM